MSRRITPVRNTGPMIAADETSGDLRALDEWVDGVSRFAGDADDSGEPGEPSRLILAEDLLDEPGVRCPDERGCEGAG